MADMPGERPQGNGGAPAADSPGWGLAARSGAALVVANVSYWRTVAPLVRGELKRWRVRAGEIEDSALRQMALVKLDEEAFNAEAGAMLATFAPSSQRANVVETIVALQLLFDLLDGLGERPSHDPLADGERLFKVFTDALRGPQSDPGGHDPYLLELANAAAHGFTGLPSGAAVSDVALAAASRAAEAQVRMHAVAVAGLDPLRSWAEAKVAGSGLGWREFSAGAASSVLALHALAACAAHPDTTERRAVAVDRAYLPLCALLTLLDGVIDQAKDAARGEESYSSLFAEQRELSDALIRTTTLALRATEQLPDRTRHVMILTGVVAYYTSTVGARGSQARKIVQRLHEKLGPLGVPAIAVLRTWRLAKGLRSRGFRRPARGR